jgi:hypothetical protein
MNDSNNYATFELFARTVDKQQFAHTIQARMRTKRVRFDKEESWFPDLESECMRFPRDVRNDQVDALAILGHGVQKFIEAPTLKEQYEEERDAEMYESGIYEQGRSAFTGY